MSDRRQGISSSPPPFTEKDVLLGREKFCRENGGNKLLGRLLHERLTEYEAADQSSDFLDKGTKKDKLVIKKEIFRAIQESGGRFLRREESQWLELKDRAAIAYLNDRLAKVRSKNKGRNKNHVEETQDQGAPKQSEPQHSGEPGLAAVAHRKPPTRTHRPPSSSHISSVATSGSHSTDNKKGLMSDTQQGSWKSAKGSNHNGDSVAAKEMLRIESEGPSCDRLDYHTTKGCALNGAASLPKGTTAPFPSSTHVKFDANKIARISQESPLSVLQTNGEMPPVAPPFASTQVANVMSRDDESIEDDISNSFSQLDLLASVATCTGKRGRAASSVGSVSSRPPCARPRTDPFNPPASSAKSPPEELTDSFDMSSIGYLSSTDGVHSLQNSKSRRAVASGRRHSATDERRSIGSVPDRMDEDDMAFSVASSGGWSGNPPLANVSVASRSKSGVLSGLSSCGSQLTPVYNTSGASLNLVGMTVAQGGGDAPSVITSATQNHTLDLKDMRSILREMKDKPDDPEMQLRGCSEISRFLWENEIKLWDFNRRKIGKEAIEIVFGTLKRHFGHPKIPFYALETFEYLCKDASHKLVYDTHRAIIESVVGFMDNPKAGAQVQENGCFILGTVAKCNTENCKSISAANGIPLIVSAMVQHRARRTVQEKACSALYELARDLECCKSIGITNGVVVVVNAMRKHRDAAQVQVNGCSTLSRLVDDTDNCRLIKEAHGVAVVLEAIRHYECDVKVQVRGIFALGKLSGRDHGNRRAIVEADGIRVVLEAMQKHFCHAQVQAAGCSALSNLVPGHKSREVIIAESCTAVQNAMKRHWSMTGVQEKACWALGELAEDTGSRRIIASRGGIESVLSSMRHHVSDASVQASACRALGRLANLNQDNSKMIVNGNGIPLLISTMRHHLAHAPVQSSACFALSHLTEASNGCKLIVKNAGIAAVIESMQRHACHDGVQKWACCLLKLLAKGGLRYQKQIRDAGGIMLIQLVKATFPDNKSLHWYADDALQALGEGVV